MKLKKYLLTKMQIQQLLFMFRVTLSLEGDLLEEVKEMQLLSGN